MKKVNNSPVHSQQGNGATNEGEAIQERSQAPEGQETAVNASQGTTNKSKKLKEAFAERLMPGFIVKGYNAVIKKGRIGSL